LIKIYFPIFEDEKSKEFNLINEGLRLHSEITLVDNPDDANYIVLLQNYLHTPKPFQEVVRELKYKHMGKTILLDYDDYHEQVYDRQNFNWFLYFKRSIVDKESARPHIRRYDLPIEHISYGANDNFIAVNVNSTRDIDVACLFNADVLNDEYHGKGRGAVLSFLRNNSFHGKTTILDTVSENGPVGRSHNCPIYFDTLRRTKILITCNPDKWEGDSRLWEALASGCMVFVDRMLTPIVNPLIDYEHLVYYDLSDPGLKKLYKEIIYYLENDEQRGRIGSSGYNFVKNHHMSVNRIQQVINQIKVCNSNNG
jgi:hypothetical protein